MIKTNLSVKQNHRHREKTGGCQGERGLREGWSGSLELADVGFYI